MGEEGVVCQYQVYQVVLGVVVGEDVGVVCWKIDLGVQLFDQFYFDNGC